MRFTRSFDINSAAREVVSETAEQHGEKPSCAPQTNHLDTWLRRCQQYSTVTSLLANVLSVFRPAKKNSGKHAGGLSSGIIFLALRLCVHRACEKPSSTRGSPPSVTKYVDKFCQAAQCPKVDIVDTTQVKQKQNSLIIVNSQSESILNFQYTKC